MPEPQPTPAEQKTKPAPNVDSLLDAALTGAPAAAATPTAPVAAPSWRDAVLDGDDIPENFRGKKVADLITSQANAQQAVSRYQSERDRAAAELQRAQTELTARQAAERSVREMLQPKEVPQEDPRFAQLNDLMFSDPPAYRALYDEIQQERTEKIVAARVAKIKDEITREAKTENDRDRGRNAFMNARATLNNLGVTDAMLLDKRRIAALYSAISLPSTPDSPNDYYDQEGPLNAGVIVKAYGDLFGYPRPATAAAPAAPAHAAAPPVVAAAPGSGRPAAPVAPPSADTAGKPMSRELAAVLESLSEEMGKPKERLAERARKRGAA